MFDFWRESNNKPPILKGNHAILHLNHHTFTYFNRLYSYSNLFYS